ncbi:unnamed protein product [Sphenostylis stenocarpa]|uniref:Uncharacterized protein n=1 Tax=Sphenostylis stenocarpa TaxID=92480 RepID=A0AA86RM49_9FABA|nr:unnamed protein product [Sphenostylis stenocarpa]
MVSRKKFMKLLVEPETFLTLKIKYSGDVAKVEKKGTLEYRSMHSAYHITASMDWEHSGSVDSLNVAFPTHSLHRRKGREEGYQVLVGAGQICHVCTAVLVHKINLVLVLSFSGWEVEEGNHKGTKKDKKDEVIGRHGSVHVQRWMV